MHGKIRVIAWAATLLLLLAPGPALSQAGGGKSDGKQAAGQKEKKLRKDDVVKKVTTSKEGGKTKKHLTFKELKIQGEREAPNVIYIVPWTPPKSSESEGDQAVDDLDGVFTSIRNLNRRFDKELVKPEDREELREEYLLKKKARAYVREIQGKGGRK